MQERKRTAQAVAAGVGSYIAVRALLRRTRQYRFEGKTVLVTGGSRGLGLEIARQAAAAGARVAICARDEPTLARAEADLRTVTPDVVAIACDVGDGDAVRAMVHEVTDRLGPIDVLVNNAGIITVGPFQTMTEQDYAEALGVNFWGTVHSTLAVLPVMRRRRQGRIVNISSIGGKIAVPHLLPYSASKFAIRGFSLGLRAELAQDNVQVVTVYPGLMRTGSPRHASFKGEHRAEYAWFSVSDSLPLISISVKRAARRVLSACERGEAEAIFPLSAKIGAGVQALAPGLTTACLALANRLLPRSDATSSPTWKGEDSESAISPSWLTALGEHAARRQNQVASPNEASHSKTAGPAAVGSARARRSAHIEDQAMASTTQSDNWLSSTGKRNSGGVNVGKNERWISAVAGAALLAYSLRRRRMRGLLVPVGAALVKRSVTGHCEINQAIGRNSAQASGGGHISPVASVQRGQGIKVEKGTVINRSPEELYRFWRNFENLPRFMNHLESVTNLDERRSHWVAKGPLGTTVEWDAEIHNEIPNELIAWRSLPDADVNNAGSVHFRPAMNGQGTDVRVVLSYEPPAGKIGATIAKLFGEAPSQQVEEDLLRFKQVMEAGELATAAGPTAGRMF